MIILSTPRTLAYDQEDTPNSLEFEALGCDSPPDERFSRNDMQLRHEIGFDFRVRKMSKSSDCCQCSNSSGSTYAAQADQDKAIKRFLVRNIVEQAAVRDVEEACPFDSIINEKGYWFAFVLYSVKRLSETNADDSSQGTGGDGFTLCQILRVAKLKYVSKSPH
ncbi:Retinoblastoma-related protein [Camellia lanceoleosa]|uniref:Retinoblastoma-related protein n=1 Tax=Camellia lanceoleosa TaxID=1840588 RepID=A0ACC0J6U2_9ERIC|nr:Retinoblastoma-related protein [Camellia lanceoleosa]